ncbi:hypothetical protein CMU25_17375 [Elizabethkingia anophelis]|nr:hypothetical protein [Elizabethkingia anophelis]MDV3842094.1 hypothetical protein [Elizabethkingia anophelis]
MELNLFKKNYHNISSILLISSSFWVMSCRSTDNMVEKEDLGANTGTLVTLNVLGEEVNNTIINAEKQASIVKQNLNASLQKQTIEGDDGFSYEISVSPNFAETNKQASIKSKAGNTLQSTKKILDNGIRFRVVVYDANTGNYVKQQDFVVGQAQAPITGLNGGQAYTFLVYSTNAATIPNLTNPTGNFSQAALSNLNNNNATNPNSPNSSTADLMYFTTQMTLEGGTVQSPYTNILTGSLKHQFARVKWVIDTSDLRVLQGNDNRAPGNITGIRLATFSNVANQASFNFSTGSATYGAGSNTITQGANADNNTALYPRTPNAGYTNPNNNYLGGGSPFNVPYNPYVIITDPGKPINWNINLISLDQGWEFLSNINATISLPEQIDYTITIKPTVKNIVDSKSYMGWDNSTPATYYSNTFFSQIAPGNFATEVNSGLLLDGQTVTATDLRWAPSIRNTSSFDLEFTNLRCWTNWAYVQNTQNKVFSNPYVLKAGTTVYADADVFTYISGGNDYWTNNSDQETCTGTMTPKGGAWAGQQKKIILRWRTIGDGFNGANPNNRILNNRLTTTIQVL